MSKKRRQPSRPKNVVYLFGAGATQAEAAHNGSSVNLLMGPQGSEPGVSAGILSRAGKRWNAFGREQGIDIEKLISLLGSVGIPDLASEADKMRGHYFLELRTRLSQAKLLGGLHLAAALFELHKDRTFQLKEKLCGILTTNHDGLLQQALGAVHPGLNLGMPFTSPVWKETLDTPPLLQLHGSFSWDFETPVVTTPITAKTPYSASMVWLPPSTSKESKLYPFNKLMGHAYELLTRSCDVLRVVGASLTQNDWNILSLIFSAQHKNVVGVPFNIELIMPESAGERIIYACSYLQNLRPISAISEGDFSDYDNIGDDVPPGPLQNPFSFWLGQKLKYHRARSDFEMPGSHMTDLMDAS